MPPNYRVGAVEKAILILNFLAEHPDSTFTEIFTTLKLSKSTVYQTLFTLEAYQYVIRTKEHRYRLDVGVLPLMHGVSRENDIVNVAREPLTRFANETGLTVHLSALTDSFRAICLFKIDGVNFTINTTAVGRELSLHTSATSKVLLAWMSSEELSPYLANITYTKYTDTTITSPIVFRQTLIETRKRGYAVDNCEGARGAMGIAVPVFDPQNKVIAAISIGAVITEIPVESYGNMADRLKEIAAEISSRMFPHT